METSKSFAVGRVRRFDAAQQCGVLAAVSGTTYFFERTGADEALPPLTAGELVTFSRPGDPQPARLATEVRVLASGRRESQPIAEGLVPAGRFARAARIAATVRTGS